MGIDPAFGAQIFQLQPHRRACRLSHGSGPAFGESTTERSNHHAGKTCRPAVLPWRHDHAVQPAGPGFDRHAGQQASHGVPVVYLQMHGQTMRTGQQTGKPPADTQITEVVDDATEDLPVNTGHRICVVTVCVSHDAPGTSLGISPGGNVHKPGFDPRAKNVQQSCHRSYVSCAQGSAQVSAMQGWGLQAIVHRNQASIHKLFS